MYDSFSSRKSKSCTRACYSNIWHATIRIWKRLFLFAIFLCTIFGSSTAQKKIVHSHFLWIAYKACVMVHPSTIYSTIETCSIGIIKCKNAPHHHHHHRTPLAHIIRGVNWNVWLIEVKCVCVCVCSSVQFIMRLNAIWRYAHRIWIK